MNSLYRQNSEIVQEPQLIDIVRNVHKESLNNSNKINSKINDFIDKINNILKDPYYSDYDIVNILDKASIIERIFILNFYKKNGFKIKTSFLVYPFSIYSVDLYNSKHGLGLEFRSKFLENDFTKDIKNINEKIINAASKGIYFEDSVGNYTFANFLKAYYESKGFKVKIFGSCVKYILKISW